MGGNPPIQPYQREQRKLCSPYSQPQYELSYGMCRLYYDNSQSQYELAYGMCTVMDDHTNSRYGHTCCSGYKYPQMGEVCPPPPAKKRVPINVYTISAIACFRSLMNSAGTSAFFTPCSLPVPIYIWTVRHKDPTYNTSIDLHTNVW